MTPPANTSRFVLLPETRAPHSQDISPKVRRYRLARVGVSGGVPRRATGSEHLRRMHD